MNSRGFTLPELVVACALVVAVVGAVVTISIPLRHSVDRTAGTTDLLAASRTALDRLAAELRMAGHGAALGGGEPSFPRVFPAIEPLGDLDGAPAAGPARAVRITSIPARVPQAQLAERADAGSVDVVVETEGCPPLGNVCGLTRAAPVVLFDGVHAELAVVDDVAAPGVVRLNAPLATAFDARATIAVVTQATYGTRAEDDGSWRLVRRTPGSEQPLASGVVLFEINTSGDDRFRVRRVEVRLRVQANDAALRGPAGPLFLRAGVSRHPAHWVPDLDMRLSIAPRNLTW